jgi:hypothetical protein
VTDRTFLVSYSKEARLNVRSRFEATLGNQKGLLAGRGPPRKRELGDALSLSSASATSFRGAYSLEIAALVASIGDIRAAWRAGDNAENCPSNRSPALPTAMNSAGSLVISK